MMTRIVNRHTKKIMENAHGIQNALDIDVCSRKQLIREIILLEWGLVYREYRKPERRGFTESHAVHYVTSDSA